MSPAKAIDDARKQSASPVDSAQSSKPAPKAWTTGTNPITQRPSASNTVNGTSNGHSSAVQEQGNTSARTSQSADKQAQDRLHFLLANFVGLDCTVTTKSGEQFAGVFSGAITQGNESRYNLKMVRKLDPTQKTNGSTTANTPFIGEGEDHAMAFDVNDTTDLAVPHVSFASSSAKPVNGAGFRTDVEISGNKDVRERVLQRWAPDPGHVDLSLGTETASHGAWDQFAANEKLYNVRSDYDENLYTTSIDKSNPRYKELEQQAERLAREIERDGEGRRTAGSGLDDEEKYSGVRRDGPSLAPRGTGAYIPPSQRPITNKPTVTGAPFDPAIISSQLARPESASGAKSQTPDSTANAQDTKKATAAGAPSTKTETALNGFGDKPRFPSVTGAGDRSTVTAADKGTDIMRDVTDAFKQFNQSEKLRFQQQQRQHQQQRAKDARQEKHVKLNDLKKFSQNFKLSSRVPEDLVPILAKSKERQDEIKAKAEAQAKEKEEQVTQGTAIPTDSKQAVPVQGSDAVPGSAPLTARTRSQQTGQGKAPPMRIAPIPPYKGPSQSSQRTATTANVPPPISSTQATATPVAGESLLSPTSGASIRFNAKAMEFRPNPTASTFTPTGASAGSESASNSKRPSVASPLPVPAAAPKADFFTSPAKKSSLASGDWASTTANVFSSVARTASQVDPQKKAQFAGNGGIPQGYRTAPVWEDYAEDSTENVQKPSYVDHFPRSIHNPPASPLHAPNGAMPHQHQLPLHLQNGGHHAQQGPGFYRGPGMGPGHDDHRMQFSSSQSSVQPSPRMVQPSLAFNGQGYPQMAGHTYAPGAGMSPGMGMRPVPAGQYMGPQGGPMGGHMMVQQPSNGPYMGHPQQQLHMYPSPGPTHVQPQFGHPSQPGMPYGSSPRGQPMSHQGSQQGHQPQGMFMMPTQGNPMVMMPQQYGGPMPMRGYQGQFQGQHPGNAYGMNHRAMSSGGYSQHMTPRQQHAMPHQGPMPAPVHPSASTNGDDR